MSVSELDAKILKNMAINHVIESVGIPKTEQDIVDFTAEVNRVYKVYLSLHQ